MGKLTFSEFQDRLGDFDYQIPWHWDQVVMRSYKTEYVDWCEEQGLKYDLNYYVETEDKRCDIVKETHFTGIPMAAKVRVHIWMFENPEFATMFRLKFGNDIYQG